VIALGLAGKAHDHKAAFTGRIRGIEDPNCLNHLMSAGRYLLTMLAPQNSVYDPHKRERESAQVTVTRRKLTQNHSR